MKSRYLAAAAVAASMLPAASAQAFELGGEISGAYLSRDWGSGANDRYRIEGSAVVGTGGFGAQLDIGAQSYADGDGFDNITYVAHAFYTISPGLVVGGYYGQDTWSGGANPWNFADIYGLEVKFVPGGGSGPFEMEAFIGWYEYADSTYGADVYGLSGSYAVTDNIDLFAGYLLGNWGSQGNRDRDGQYDVLTLGAAYNFDSGIYVLASYHDFYWPGQTPPDYAVQLLVGYQFGGGKVFGGRSYFHLYPGD